MSTVMLGEKLKIQQEFEALLEMISPSEDYRGGAVSYDFASEYHSFNLEYIDKLHKCIRALMAIMVNQQCGQVEAYLGSEEHKALQKFTEDNRGRPVDDEDY